MRQRGEATPLITVGALLALGVAGVRARGNARWSFAGPFAHVGGTTLAVLTSILVLAAVLPVLAFFAALRRRRKSGDDDFEAVHEPLGTKWGRRRAVLITLAVVAAPLVILAVVASRATPPTQPPVRFVPSPPADAPSVASPGGGPSWLLPVVLLAALLLLLLRWHRRAPRPIEASGGLAEAAAAGRGEIVAAVTGGPRGAILRSFAAMERALAQSAAAPRLSDTPSAVLARAADAGLVRAEPAQRLVDVFAEARFSRHPITGAHQETARQALDELLHDLGRQP